MLGSESIYKRIRFGSLVLVAAALLAGTAQAAPIDHLAYDYDAARDTVGDATWESETAATANRDWTFDKTAQPIAVTGTGTTITKAYDFGGSLTTDPAYGGTTTFDGSDVDDNSTFEFWLKPDDLVGQEYIFETGANVSGLAFALDGTTLRFAIHANNGETETNVTLPAVTDFIQVVGVINEAHNTLYVNGAQADDVSDAVKSPKGWAGGNSAGLGAENANGPDEFEGYDTFDGQIARIRFYDEALTGTEIQGLYNAMLPEPATLALLAAGVLGVMRRRRR